MRGGPHLSSVGVDKGQKCVFSLCEPSGCGRTNIHARPPPRAEMRGDRGAASRPGTFSTGGSKRTAMCEGLRFMLGLCFALQAVVEHLGLDAVDAEAQMQRGVDCIGREGARE